MTRLVTFIMMFGFWIALSGYFDAFHIVSGIVCSLIVTWLSSDLLVPAHTDLKTEFRRAGRFLLYLPWLLKEIFTANLWVAYRVLHPRMPIDPRLLEIKTNIRTEIGIVTFAHSVTLTPGTVTIAASKDGSFLIHAISEQAASTLLDGELARRVKAIEGEDV